VSTWTVPLVTAVVRAIPLCVVRKRCGGAAYRSWRRVGRVTGIWASCERRYAPGRITDEHVEALVARTLGQAPPAGDSRWSTRSMAGAVGMPQSAISRIWRVFSLKPYIVETWKLSTYPRFVTRVRDVVGIYLAPPEKALILAAIGRRHRPAGQ
jgi:hypothetical protein